MHHAAMGGYIKAKLKANLKTYVVPRSSERANMSSMWQKDETAEKRDYDCSY